MSTLVACDEVLPPPPVAEGSDTDITTSSGEAGASSTGSTQDDGHDSGGTTGGSDSDASVTTTDDTSSDTTRGEDPETTRDATTADESTDEGMQSTGERLDADGDGYLAPDDCDDDDPAVHPGAPERCNGVDDDCDPATAEDGLISIDGSGAWTDLSDAVFAAPAGSELRICPGTYVEHLSIDKDLSLVAQQDASVTIIEGWAMATVVEIIGGAVDLDGLTITGANNPDFFGGGGVSVWGLSPVTVRDCVLTGNVGTQGGGLYAHASTHVEITHTTIADNLADFGGGITSLGDVLTLTDSTVEANVADSAGGGVYVLGATVELSSSAIIDNEASHVGGLAVHSDAVVTATECVFERNVSTMWPGGGAELSGGGATLTSVDSDWGTGVDDNLPDDVVVFMVGAWSSYGNVESFQCDAAGCF